MGYDWTERRISTRRLNDEMCQAVEDETISSIRQLIARGFGGVGQAGTEKSRHLHQVQYNNPTIRPLQALPPNLHRQRRLSFPTSSFIISSHGSTTTYHPLPPVQGNHPMSSPFSPSFKPASYPRDSPILWCPRFFGNSSRHLPGSSPNRLHSSLEYVPYISLFTLSYS